ncbi:MAG: hypothetical protein QOK39_410 [Acidimicrobiaceae bacterium]|jgi:hypothetical protein|nr:hypothetical protein [Acidimicrobiaceae bacterium]
MAWKQIAPQPVNVSFDGDRLELDADRWDDFSGAIGCSVPAQAGERITVLAGEYTPLDEKAFEDACAGGTRI